MADQEFRIETDSPVADDLMFWSIAGHEALARPSFYELTVLSENRAINAKDILGRAFDVVIEFLDQDGVQHKRHCQGYAVRLTRIEAVGRYCEYRIVLRSWFWLLTKRTNSRILQDKPALDIFKTVLDDSAIQKIQKFEKNKVIAVPKVRPYCVQHQESDYHYLSRLLEDEGIYYWFDAHDEPGKMHLADASDIAHDKLPVVDTLEFSPSGSSEARYNEISEWISARQFDSGRYASRDTNYETINVQLGANVKVEDDHELADLEAFEYAGGYQAKADSDIVGRRRGDELDGRRDRHWALTSWPDVSAGSSFTYKGDSDPARDGDYVIAACTFFVSHPGHEGNDFQARPRSVADILGKALADDAVNVDTADVLEELIRRNVRLREGSHGTSAFLLTVFPMDMPYRPPRLTPRVVMPGPQTAIVVGAEGKDHDVDELGRVQVHFFWDRYDESNEKSTCRIRVSQPWAGKGWGGYFAPRIGQEVIVDFINGDPDRPIIMGRVYNTDQAIPYKSASQSGFKTRSTPDGGANNFNEIMFEDKKGAELLKLHAERNMATSVEVDDSTTVGHDQSLTVENDRHVVIKKFETHKVGMNQDVEITGFNTTKVGKDYALMVTGNSMTQTKGFRTDTSILGELRTVGVGQTIAVAGPVVHGSHSLAITTKGELKVATGSTAFASDADTTVTTGGERKDVSTGKHVIASTDKIKLVGAAGIDILTPASITSISTTSDTTVLGSDSSGYIGSSSEAAMGMSRSTFMGLQMSNFLGLGIENFGGLKISNCASIGITNTAAIDLNQATIGFELKSLHSFNGGAGGGAATGAAIAGGVVGLIAAIFGVKDTLATLKQYDDAIATLQEAITDVGPETPLGQKLSEMVDAAGKRRRQPGEVAGRAAEGAAAGQSKGAAIGGVLGGPVGAAAGAAAGGVLGGLGVLGGEAYEGLADAWSGDSPGGSAPAGGGAGGAGGAGGGSTQGGASGGSAGGGSSPQGGAGGGSGGASGSSSQGGASGGSAGGSSTPQGGAGGGSGGAGGSSGGGGAGGAGGAGGGNGSSNSS